jgi:hypothetical protein
MAADVATSIWHDTLLLPKVTFKTVTRVLNLLLFDSSKLMFQIYSNTITLLITAMFKTLVRATNYTMLTDYYGVRLHL